MRYGTMSRYRPRFGRGFKSFRRPAASYRRKRFFGAKTRSYLKGKSYKLQTASYFGNIYPSINDNAAVPIVQFDQSARTVWFGTQYTPGAALPMGMAAGVYDALNNPTTVGNGMLAKVNARDANIDFATKTYSAATVTTAGVIAGWNRLNPQINIRNVYVKAIKITAVVRDLTQTQMFFIEQESLAQEVPKFRESIGKARCYVKTRPVPGQPVGNVQWRIPDINIGGAVGSRLKVKIYYKMKKIANS